jgi:hypothetical protein
MNPEEQILVHGEAYDSSPLTDEERSIVSRINGGQRLLEKIDRKVGGEKGFIHEARLAIDMINRGEPIVELDNEILRQGKKGLKGEKLTDIDSETATEIIQVKSGDYSKAKKLSDLDGRQMTETLRYRNRLAKSIPNGSRMRPKTIVFHFTSPPVSKTLIDWLESKGIEVRVGQLQGHNTVKEEY